MVAEIKYQIRRLMHHPSIVLWDSSNENDGRNYSALFEWVEHIYAEANNYCLEMVLVNRESGFLL